MNALAALAPEELVLSPDQDKASKRITNFMLDPDQRNLILKGYAGTGKSTLLKHVFDSIGKINKLAEITGSDKTDREMLLTATTNKAAGALRQTTGRGAETVHSQLKLVLTRDPETQKQQLITSSHTREIHNAFLIIDEAYMADNNLLKIISEYTKNTKILWVGDPAQLLPVGMSYMPLIAEGFESVALNNVVRQAADSPIIQLTTLCRFAVETGRFFKFKPDGEFIQHVPREKFASMMLDSFDEHYNVPGEVKVLAWTNKTALGWNGHVKRTMKGTGEISVGDYVVVNSAIQTRNAKLRTDQTVQVTRKTPKRSLEGLDGYTYELDSKQHAWMPTHLDEKLALMKSLRSEKTMESRQRHAEIEDTWVDLRDEYACTINKSQGSTYGTAYIDLADIARCRNPNALARLLYVATSRPRDKIVLTGDLQ